MIIRPYRPTDIDQILALYRETIRAVNSRDYTPEQIASWAPDDLDPVRWNSRFSNSATLVAEGDGEVILGFANIENGRHIDCVYVHKDHQGEGIASGLLAALEAEARREGARKLYTDASITALPFFERRGYVVIAEQHVLIDGLQFRNYKMEKVLGFP